jgi:hypothetical protein
LILEIPEFNFLSRAAETLRPRNGKRGLLPIQEGWPIFLGIGFLPKVNCAFKPTDSKKYFGSIAVVAFDLGNRHNCLTMLDGLVIEDAAIYPSPKLRCRHSLSCSGVRGDRILTLPR